MTPKSDFDNQVLSGLKKCGVNLSQLSVKGGILGAAVSGGADSVTLLVSLASICKQFSIPLKVITVNHYIREKDETCGDVEFVQGLCHSLSEQGYDVTLTIHELVPGQVTQLAQKNNIGIEAAARDLRYNAFDEFIKREKIDFLCLAHNKNDQLETLLMRFIQGAGSDSSQGIPSTREKFIRPLLWTDRTDIESYLIEKNLTWRTDSTNSDNTYLRNKIRNELVPLLNERFSGWDTSVILGAQKASDDSEVLKNLAQDFINEHATQQKASDSQNKTVSQNKTASQNITVELDATAFYKLERALKIRVLLLAANACGISIRIPYVFLLDICDCADNYIEEKCKNAVKTFSNLSIILKKDRILIKKADEIQKETVFSAIIQKSGMYETPAGQVFVPDNLEFPVLLRSWRTDDTILTSDNKLKKVKDILSDWHIAPELRQFVPVVQALNEPEQKLLCVLGSCIGCKDWIVKNEKM